MARKDISDEMVCAAYATAAYIREFKGKIVWPDQLLEERTGHHPKVVWRAMERACDRGLVDYGTALHLGWLTDKGKALIVATKASASA